MLQTLRSSYLRRLRPEQTVNVEGKKLRGSLHVHVLLASRKAQMHLCPLKRC